MKKLTVKGRYLAWQDGTPFFYLGDTAWELFHRLSREEIEHYFRERSRMGFTAVQAVALSEFEGTTVPNFYGRLPLLFKDKMPSPEMPDTKDGYSYWHHVDFAVDEAAKYGIFLCLLPTWGDKFNVAWGKGPKIFTADNAYLYGKWIGERYRDKYNIIWMLGGDRPLEKEHRGIVDAMARGIKESGDNHLITFHPCGARDSTDFVLDADYIDFHTSQTGHGTELCYESYSVMEKMGRASEKPFLDSEPRYEDHPACFNDKIGYYWNAEDVRQNAYWNVLSAACGHTYGNHCIWSMNRQKSPYFPFTWEEALNHEGAEQMVFLKDLRLSRNYFSLAPCTEILAQNFDGMGHMAAARGEGYAYVYSPLGAVFTVNLNIFANAKQIRAKWFDPRTGLEDTFGIFPPAGQTMVCPPSCGKGRDWVLILEAVE